MIKVEEPSKHKENKTIYNTGTVKDIASLIAESWSKKHIQYPDVLKYLKQDDTFSKIVKTGEIKDDQE